MDRKMFSKHGLKGEEVILEFGPSYNPMYPKREGYNTEIVDHCGEEELRKLGYTAEFDDGVIEHVDYICSSEYCSYIKEHGGGDYDIIAASHMIEHTIDLIGFLQDLSQLLKNDGVVKLVIPDKRYEFDCFRDNLSLRSVINTHYYCDKMKHSIGAMLENALMTVKVVGGNVFRLNSISLFDDETTFSYAEDDNIDKAINILKNKSGYEFKDIHSWVFTPSSFECLITQLNVLELIDLKVSYIDKGNDYVLHNSCQFFVELKKGKIENPMSELRRVYYEKKKDEYGAFSMVTEVVKQVEAGKRLYIYGTGDGAQLLADFLGKMNVGYEGFVVSTGMRKNPQYLSRDVLEISELEDFDKSQLCVLLGVINEDFRKEIEIELSRRKIKWVF